MKKLTPLLPLFEQYIKDSKNGKRRKKNGEKIRASTIGTYGYVYRNLLCFCKATEYELRIADASKLNTRERRTEKNYWKKFYRNYTKYLYQKGCHDNYVGHQFKQIRSFFNYLKFEKDLATGDFQRLFYVREEEIEIRVLSVEQLKFLIHDTNFNRRLTPEQRRVKEQFVFGCATGLRFSDLFGVTNKDFELIDGQWYLKVRTKKTKTFSLIKLPDFAVDIYHRHKSKSIRKPVFKAVSLFIFNRHLKNIGEKAGWTYPVSQIREQMGKEKEIFQPGTRREKRFCDLISSHMMRRTAITTMLILGMPVHLVRNVSGHTNDSKSFYRYVHFAQSYMDREIEKVHMQLENVE